MTTSKADTSATRRARLIRALTMIQNVRSELPVDSNVYCDIVTAQRSLEAVLHNASDEFEQFLPYIRHE